MKGIGAYWKNCRITDIPMGAGFALRLFYVLCSTIYDRQYDIGMIDLDAGHTVTGGHLAYIQYFYENWKLPDFDPTSVYQFHHPPLHHYVCALWMKFLSLFVHHTDVLEEAIQVVPFVSSLLILVVLFQILQSLALEEDTVCFLMTLFAFHPALVLLSGSVNNDCMSLLFTLLCVYTAMRWSQQQGMGNAIAMALSLGLGMLTKQNVAQMAFPMAFVFLYVLVTDYKRHGWWRLKKRLWQCVVFGAISVPLGMAFYVRNAILYRMPLVWVYTLPKDSWQYTGNVPVVNRFLWPIPQEMLDNLLHFKVGCGYNVWMQLIRTSVLGEWDMAGVGAGVKVLAVLLMAVGALLAFLALLAFVKIFLLGTVRCLCIRDCRRWEAMVPVAMPHRILFAAGYLVHLLFYLKFAYDYPQQCSMHFRYIEIELLFPAVALGLVWQRMGETGKIRGRRVLTGLLALFCLLSTAMVGVWCLG